MWLTWSKGQHFTGVSLEVRVLSIQGEHLEVAADVLVHDHPDTYAHDSGRGRLQTNTQCIDPVVAIIHNYYLFTLTKDYC